MKMNIRRLLAKKEQGEKIVMVTAYDHPGAVLAEQAGVDMILVGDSLGNNVLGYETTTPVTVEDILHHTRAVARGAKDTLVMADMPFGSYQISVEQAVTNAIRFIKEGGAQAVKLEGGLEVSPLITALTKAGIPVMAHIGLLPQTAGLWHGYRIQGRDAASAQRLLETAQALEQAGAFSVLLECVASEAAGLISRQLQGPTIGIGSGPDCDGQVLVFHDLVGLNENHLPRFVKQYGLAAEVIRQAIGAYAAEVRQGVYPDADHSFPMEEEELQKLY